MTFPTGQSAKLAAVTEELIEMIRAEAGDVNVTADSSLLDGGMDSVKVMSLVFKIETRYDIALEPDDNDDLRTVDDLARLVLRRIEEQP
jgi:acyl carrier protein